MKSYLVSLGFEVDQPELRKFELGLKDAAGAVQSRTGGVVADLIKWQVAATSAFISIGGAVVGMAEHVANADQKFRLMGQRMFQTTEQTRKQQTALDSLGLTMDEVLWDPESRARFNERMEMQDKLTRNLGSGFEANMVTIRNLSGEFSKLGITFQYLSAAFVSTLVDRFRPQIEAITVKLQEWGDYLAENMPHWIDLFVTGFTPALKDTWGVLETTGRLIKDLGLLFIALVNVFAQDDALRGSELTFEKIATALGHVLHYAGLFLHTIVLAEEAVVHFATAAVTEVELVIAVLTALFTGKWDSVGKLASRVTEELKKGAIDAVYSFGAGLVTGAPGLTKQMAEESPDIKPFVDFEQRNAAGPPTAKALTEIVTEHTDRQAAAAGAGSHTAVTDLIDQSAEKRGVDPRLAEAVATQESGQKEFRKDGSVLESGAGARGVMQLMPSTARGLGVNADDTAQNVDGGVMLLKKLIDKYQSIPKALAAYNWGEGHLDQAIKRHSTNVPAETTNYVRNIEAQMGHSMTVGEVNVAITGNTKEGLGHEEIAAAVHDGIERAAKKQQKQTQRNVAQLGYAG